MATLSFPQLIGFNEAAALHRGKLPDGIPDDIAYGELQ